MSVIKQAENVYVPLITVLITKPYFWNDKLCPSLLLTCKMAYTVNSLYRKHCRDLELVSSLVRAHKSGSPFQSNVYFCLGFSCCPYHQGAHYSGVSARRELKVMAIWSLFKEKTHIMMICPLSLSVPFYWKLWYTIMLYAPVASSSTLPLVDFLYCVTYQWKLTSPCTQPSSISLIIENWCKQPVVFVILYTGQYHKALNLIITILSQKTIQ